MRFTWILLVVVALSIAPLCSASITATADSGGTPVPGHGTPAPGATLGHWFMTPFPDASDENNTLVSSVDSPLQYLAGEVSTVDFLDPDDPDIRLTVNSNASWTDTYVNPYSGKVYFTQVVGSYRPSSLILTLPSNTVAFYLYATANWTGTHDIEATARGTITTNNGPLITQTTSVSQGARYYGFYADGEFLTEIELNNVVGDLNKGFELGEFGITKANTLPGGDVTVTDPETGTTISFATVTQSGQTIVTKSDPGDTQGPPVGFKVGEGASPTIFNISTTALFGGIITIGINYSQMGFDNESNLELFHFDEDAGGWDEITTELDMANNMIYGTVESLSEFAVFEREQINHPPVANAGPDQTVEGTIPDGALVILDGSASTDPDSSPGSNDIIGFEWREGTTPLGTGEIISCAFPLGSHTVTLRVTDAFGEIGEDEVIITVEDTTPPGTTVNIENAKVCWDHSDIHMEGKLYPPQGFWMNNLDAVGSAVIRLAGDEVADQSVDFEIAGKKDDKWEYKDKENFYGNLKEFKIDWKGAKFDYKGDDRFHIHAPFIGGTETTLCIHTGDVSGAFTVIIDGTTIYYDAERNITTGVDYDPQKDRQYACSLHSTLRAYLSDDDRGQRVNRAHH